MYKEVFAEILTVINGLILFLQLYLKAEIKRLDEKINLFTKRLERVEDKINSL